MEKLEPTTIEDAILAGILQALGHKVAAKYDTNLGRVIFEVSGDIQKTLDNIYQNNCAIGSRDALQAIKNLRTLIFSLRNVQQAAGNRKRNSRYDAEYATHL